MNSPDTDSPDHPDLDIQVVDNGQMRGCRGYFTQEPVSSIATSPWAPGGKYANCCPAPANPATRVGWGSLRGQWPCPPHMLTHDERAHINLQL